MRFASVSMLAAATLTMASPVEPRAKTIALPLRKVQTVTSAKNLVARGQSKLRQVNGDKLVGNIDASSGPATNEDVTYVASVTVGGAAYSLIVDTGSSNTWVGAGKAYSPGPNSQDTGNSVSVSYGSGSFNGEEYTDTVTFAGLTVKAQSIGVASSATGFSGVDGIIGFGPVDLTENTVSNTNTVPTFLDNLYSQGTISQEVLGVSFQPESGSDTSDTNGELTLGGTDSSKYTGSITYFPAPGPYWGATVQSFKYGTKTLGSGGSGIVDTGTTLIYIPTSAYNAFLSAAGGKTDSSSGLSVFTKKPTSNFVITINGVAYSLTPAQYLVPTAQYSYYGLTSGKYYSWINNGGSSGVNTIIGQKFLENYYSVFDTNNARVGFATAA